MSLFRRDASASLEKARASLAAAEAKIAELLCARETKLVDTDELDSVQAIDRAIEAQRRAVRVYEDRIGALKGRARKDEQERRERERDVAIAKIRKRCAAQVELARELEATLKRMSDLYFELRASRISISEFWPSAPASVSRVFTYSSLPKEFSYALYAAGRPNAMSLSHMPPPTSAPAVAGMGAQGVANSILADAEMFIAQLKQAPVVVEPEDDNDETEEAA